MTLENSNNKSLPQKNDKITDSITTFGECLRNWEPYQKKGSDPNEVRMLDILECWTGELGPAIGLVGIPFDSAVLGRKGAKAGPKKIRDSIRYYKAYSWDLDYWFGDKRVGLQL
ncbi:MAG: arginase family protein [Candidatus Heimdallarchaeota archaeon]